MKGCLIALGIIVAIFLIITGVVTYKVYTTYKSALAWTSTAPAKLDLSEFSPEEEKLAEQKFKNLKDAINKNESKTFEFTASDINILIRKNETLKDHALIDIKDNYIYADVSIPLNMIPGFKGRYLNGSVTLSLKDSKDKVILKLIDLKTDKKTPPSSFLKGLTKNNLLDSAYKNKEQSKVLNKIKSAIIKDDKIIITLKGSAIPPDNPSENPDSSNKNPEPEATEKVNKEQ